MGGWGAQRDGLGADVKAYNSLGICQHTTHVLEPWKASQGFAERHNKSGV